MIGAQPDPNLNREIDWVSTRVLDPLKAKAFGPPKE